MKKVLAIVLASVFALSVLTACGAEAAAPAAPAAEAAAPAAKEEAAPAAKEEAAPAAEEALEPIKVGVFQPLTGQSAYMGQAGVNAAKMAAEEINAAGGILGHQVEIVEYDDKSSPEEAVKCVNKMIEVDNVNAIIGSLHSGNIQACGDIIEEAGIPCYGTGTSPQWLQKGWTYLFRPTISTYYTSLSAIQICDTLGLKNIGIFYSQDEYGKNGNDNMVALCEEYGINVLGAESMKPGDSDFTAQVAKLKSLNPDGLYVIATADNLPQMIKAIRQGGIDGYLFGEQSLGSPQIKEIAGKGSDKLVFGACYIMPSTDPAEAQIPEVVKFFEDYQTKFGEMCPTEVAGRNYDGLYLYKTACEKAGSIEGEAVRDAMYTISDFKGLQGNFDFSKTKDGEGLTESRLYITMDLKDIPLEDYLAQQ